MREKVQRSVLKFTLTLQTCEKLRRSRLNESHLQPLMCSVEAQETGFIRSNISHAKIIYCSFHSEKTRRSEELCVNLCETCNWGLITLAALNINAGVLIVKLLCYAQLLSQALFPPLRHVSFIFLFFLFFFLAQMQTNQTVGGRFSAENMWEFLQPQTVNII